MLWCWSNQEGAAVRTFLTYLCLAVTGIMISAPCVRAQGCRAVRTRAVTSYGGYAAKKVVDYNVNVAFVAVPVVPVVLLQGAYYQPPPPPPAEAVASVTKVTRR